MRLKSFTMDLVRLSN